MSQKSSTQVILDAIHELHQQEQVVTRETLSQIVDLKMQIIDDRLSYLIETGQIMRVQRGVYVPCHKHPPARLITKTALPDGTVKIDIGDDHVLTLTPKEARTLGSLMLSDAMQFSNIQTNYHLATLQQQLSELKSQ